MEDKFHILELPDAVLLEGVPIGVTKVSNNVFPLVFLACMLPQP